MITISKLGVGTAQDYYRTHFADAMNRYYASTLDGRWQGLYAQDLGLQGAVTDEQFERMTNGQDPWTGLQLIKWRIPQEPEPAWVRNDAAWRAYIDSLFERVIEEGRNPLYPADPLTFATDTGALRDALRFIRERVERTAPGLRQETNVWIMSHLGLEREAPEKVRATEQHVAAWDITLRAHKTVSLVALVGGDYRMVEGVRRANDKALAVGERYMQQRMGGWRAPETTAKWAIATFEHDTARPVNGYAAPLLHHHNLVMNMTAPDGTEQARAVWSKEFYKAQMLMEAEFQAEIALVALECGYQIRKGPTNATEIVGFTQEYVDAESQRHRVINERLEELGLTGSVEAGKLVAMETREKKLGLTPEQQQAVHHLHAEQFGHQARAVVDAAIAAGPQPRREISAEEAVEFARSRNSERYAVFEHYGVMRDALVRGWGALTADEVAPEIERRRESGNLVAVGHFRNHAPEYRYTTPEQLRLERETIERMVSVQNSMDPILPNADLSKRPEFSGNPLRLKVLEGILKTRDQIVGLNGSAGSAKTSSMRILAEYGVSQGYSVQGLAPTGTAVTALSLQGVRADTLQRHIIEQLGSRRVRRNGIAFEPKERPEKVLYLLDEASQVPVRQMYEFFLTMRPQDRAVLVGDDAPNTGQVGQHTSVESGRPFWQLQAAGMKTAQLRKNYRQKTEELRAIVACLRQAETEEALDKLREIGGVREVQHRQERFTAIGQWFAESPAKALVVVPDNLSRRDINKAIREALREHGFLAGPEVDVEVLTPRDVLAMDRTRADNYRVHDVVRYLRDIESLGVLGKSYGTVLATDRESNTITVLTEDGRRLEYCPARTGAGVQVFERRAESFATGEQIQFTAADKHLGITNRTTGTIEQLDPDGNAKVRLSETGRTVGINIHQHRHLEYGYTSTSHSAQARTVERCAAQVDTDDYRTHSLVHQVFSYVAGSRPELELAVFTDNASELSRVMGRVHEIPTGLSMEQTQACGMEMGRETRPEMGMAV